MAIPPHVPVHDMKTRSPSFIQQHQAQADGPQGDRAEAIAGLLQPQAIASPKFFYDRLGSHLFDAITELPEYYPTRAEAALFAAHGAEMARQVSLQVGSGITLIDLGAGNCRKAARLLPLLDPAHYIAADISADYLRDALRRLQREHPTLQMTGVGMDLLPVPHLPPGLIDKPGTKPVFFYPGSSIGNLRPDEAAGFLAGLRSQASGGGLLIGVDLVKDTRVLEAAYDDAIGVTAAFNLNLLRRLNAVIGSDFDPVDWRHRARFDTALSRIEMHLEARRDLAVRWPGGERRFVAGETLHTENSYKYAAGHFEAMLTEAGFRDVRLWESPAPEFAVFWATAD